MKKLIQQYAKDLTSGRLASGYEHSYRVYHLSREIGDSMDYEDDILHASCFLHDIQMAMGPGHPKSSAEKAKAILQETGFKPAKIDRVYSAILNHMPGGEVESIEGELLHDANLLDSIGAIGICRLSIGSFFWHHFKTMEDVLDYLKKWLAHAENFYFPKSKEMAKDKISFMSLAVKQFSQELSL